ncbi:unnamed protein product [Sympodiomycopsis kandeliae]
MTSLQYQPYNGVTPAPTKFELHFLAEGVLLVSLNNQKVNPWSDIMTHEMTTIFSTITHDPNVSVVILSGSGSSFCAGLDVKESSLMDLIDEDPARSAFKLKRHIDEFQYALTSMEKCMKPVISAVHGIVFGLGVDLMCATDIRFADEKSRFCIKEVDIGLAADIGSLQRFPKIVGNDSITRELAYTAREFHPPEAEKIGFISKITKGGRDGVIQAALETALQITSKPPVAIRSTKAILLHSRDHSVPESLDYVSVWNAAMLQSSDIPLAMQNALSKNKKDRLTFPKL